jgi:hypothetical protein
VVPTTTAPAPPLRPTVARNDAEEGVRSWRTGLPAVWTGVLNTDGYSVGTPGEPGVGLEGAGRLPQRNWVVKYSSDRVRVAVPALQ